MDKSIVCYAKEIWAVNILNKFDLNSFRIFFNFAEFPPFWNVLFLPDWWSGEPGDQVLMTSVHTPGNFRVTSGSLQNLKWLIFGD